MMMIFFDPGVLWCWRVDFPPTLMMIRLVRDRYRSWPKDKYQWHAHTHLPILLFCFHLFRNFCLPRLWIFGRSTTRKSLPFCPSLLFNIFSFVFLIFHEFFQEKNPYSMATSVLVLVINLLVDAHHVLTSLVTCLRWIIQVGRDFQPDF